ncbi:MAG: glycoside hydrolase family 113 [Promethearchaeota archaeon]
MILKDATKKRMIKKSLFASILITFLIIFPAIILTNRPTFSWIEGNERYSFKFAKGIAYLGHWTTDGLSRPENFQDIQEMMGNGSNYIALSTFWYQDYLNSTIIYNSSSTHDLISVGRFIDYIHGNGSSVLFKPMLDVSTGEWRSWISPTEEWWKSWHDWTIMMAKLAENHSVEIFSVGCEMGNTEQNVSEWRDLISDIRQVYSGKLTYAANWDAVFRIEWWDALDFIGIDAWYPLTTKLDPTITELRTSWNGIGQHLELISRQWNRPILFTEMGYQSRDGCNMMPWDVKFRLVEDQQEQADCYEAFLTSNVYHAPWFAGCFWWAWSVSEKYWDNDTSNPKAWIFNHSPNGKLAGEIINKYYHQAILSREDTSCWNYIVLSWVLELACISFLVAKKKNQEIHSNIKK